MTGRMALPLLLFLSASLAWPLASAAPDAAAHSLLRRSLLLRDSQLPRSGRQASDRFDPDFFDADGFGDFAREDFRSRGGFRQDEFRDSPEIALVSRRRDGEREEDVYYADPADLWGGDIPGLDYSRRQEHQQSRPLRQPPQQHYRRTEQQQQHQQQHRRQPQRHPQRPRYREEPRPQYQYDRPEVEAEAEAEADEEARRYREQLREYEPQKRRGVERTSSRHREQQQPIDRADVAPTEFYKPASGPAYATATNVDELGLGQTRRQLDIGPGPQFADIPFPPAERGPDVPADQRSLEAAVIAGANAYKPDGGVYQKEDRLEFQIHGHQGPHSYRYGYDTGHGYNRQFRYEERDKDGHVRGRYGFFDRHGKLQIVNYSADPYKGFHAEGAHVPHYPH